MELDLRGLTFRHRKRGTTYTVIGIGLLQTERPLGDEQPLVIYQGPDGSFWARPQDEFLDGRFERTNPNKPEN